MNTKVCKFGGTSMANSDNINNIADIINTICVRTIKTRDNCSFHIFKSLASKLVCCFCIKIAIAVKFNQILRVNKLNNINNIADIINSDQERRYIIVSAPGKRNSNDRKITDMLYACYHEVELNGECKETFDQIRERYVEIVEDLKLDVDINKKTDFYKIMLFMKFILTIK